MIEKTIHYIWLGNKEIPEKFLGFIRSWQELHPDWEIIKWNEENFDCEGHSWVKAAIKKKNWALAADFIRSYVLLNYGGVYLDTDIELLKPLNELTAENDFFIGYESDLWFGSAVLGAKKGHRLIKEVHERYLTPCKKVTIGSNMLTVFNFSASTKRLYNIKLDGKTIKLDDNVKLFSTEYFYPKNYITHRIKITENTIAIHHLSSTWHSLGKLIGRRIAKGVWLILRKHLFSCFERIARVYMFWQLNSEYKKRHRKN
ncbi:MAG: hypothetical protein FWD14_07230 [Treponema sp.]|nr:hypothetical protein [Treponema sp.]